MNKTALIIIIVLLVSVGGYFLLKSSYQTPAPITPEVTAPKKTSELTAPEEVLESREVVVVGTEYAFSPSTITVKIGQRVKINFQNEGRAIHNLVIEGLGISTKTIRGGRADTIEFTAPTSGTYTIFCSVPGHRAAGMIGSLMVE